MKTRVSRARGRAKKEGEDAIYLEEVEKEGLNLAQLDPDMTRALLKGNEIEKAGEGKANSSMRSSKTTNVWRM
jgi:hypothetical protein